jgi:Holliday junction resolvase RusA-like endonuclease
MGTKIWGILLTTPIAISLEVYIQRPKSHYGTGKNKLVLKDKSPQYCIVKPDNDNIEKIVWDGLNKIAFIDDCIIISNKTHKQWCYSDPRVEVTIYTKF